jgi:hypothetical protein
LLLLLCMVVRMGMAGTVMVALLGELSTHGVLGRSCIQHGSRHRHTVLCSLTAAHAGTVRVNSSSDDYEQVQSHVVYHVVSGSNRCYTL